MVPFPGPTQGGTVPWVKGPRRLSSSGEGGRPFFVRKDTELSIFSAVDGELTTLALVKRTGPSLGDALSLTLQTCPLTG